MAGSITFKGTPLTLVGIGVKLNEPAGDARLISKDLKETRLSDISGKIKVITSFPSLDTPVCDFQVKEFNKRLSTLGDKAAVIGVSMDLPFAQKRFCQDHEINNLITLSDYKYSSFGINYGLLIKELNLLARAIIVVDVSGMVRYLEIAGETAEHLDYNKAEKAVMDVLTSPSLSGPVKKLKKCMPCEAGTPPLGKAEVNDALSGLKGWMLVDDIKLVREFKFKDFAEAKYFVDIIAALSEEQGHHPNIFIAYNKVKLTLTTHASGGLTGNDLIMAGLINRIQD